MKGYLLFLMLFPLALYSQEEYKPLLKDGRCWNHTFVSAARNYNKSLTIQGDTLIGGVTWKKVYNGNQYEKALLEDGQKVFELMKGEPAESQQLLFNFGLQVGERQHFATLGENEERYLEVTDIDYINSENRKYRILKLHQVIKSNGETVYSADSFWIEGIGSECGIEKPCQWVDVTGYTCQLQTCFDNDECIFNISSMDTGMTMKPADKQKGYHMYDLQGRPTNQAHGIFIQNGRKHLTRK